MIDENSPFVHRGLYNLDPGRRGFGGGVDGAMTHYTKVPERLLHHIPATLPFEVPLAEWHDAFEAMHSGEIVKAVLLPAQ